MLLAKHLNKDYDEASLGPYGKTWLDYVVTSTSLSSKDLRPLPYDQSRKFLDRCITDPSYHVDPENMSDYCKDGLFRLTTSFNNGALRCRCNTEGSNGFSCKAYGGQCSCKPNVIGRQCTECKAGYYGFPNCKKCQCPPNAVCNKVRKRIAICELFHFWWPASLTIDAHYYVYHLHITTHVNRVICFKCRMKRFIV